MKLTLKKIVMGNLKARAVKEGLTWSPVLSHWTDRCEIATRNSRILHIVTKDKTRVLKTKWKLRESKITCSDSILGPSASSPRDTFEEHLRSQGTRGK